MKQLKELSIAGLLDRTAIDFPNHIAIKYKNTSITYKELNKTTEDVAKKLRSLNINPTDNVALWMDASPEALILFYALQKLGYAVILINTTLRGHELQKNIKFADVGLILVQDEESAILLLAELKDYCYQDTKQSVLSFKQGCSLSVLTFEDVMALQQQDDNWPDINSNAFALGLFTSGTSFHPCKLVCLQGIQLVNSAFQKSKDLRMDQNSRVCCILPLFHTFCINANVLAALAAAATLVIPNDRHTRSVLESIADEKCTHLSSVPSMFFALVKKQESLNYDLTSLKFGIVGGAFCSPQKFVDIEKKLGLTLLSSLGQTEVVGGITICNPEDSLDVRANTVGHFVDLVEGKIDTSNLEEYALRKIGEILVRGPMIMNGYYGCSESVCDEDGWLHTGDLGWLDEDQNLHLSGRLKEIIIRGGENIVPYELELYLNDDPRIKICKVMGVPDNHYGESVCVCIVPSQTGHLSELDVIKILSNKIAKYKLPKHILFLDSMPFTTTGKIHSKQLQSLVNEHISKNK